MTPKWQKNSTFAQIGIPCQNLVWSTSYFSRYGRIEAFLVLEDFLLIILGCCMLFLIQFSATMTHSRGQKVVILVFSRQQCKTSFWALWGTHISSLSAPTEPSGTVFWRSMRVLWRQITIKHESDDMWPGEVGCSPLPLEKHQKGSFLAVFWCSKHACYSNES